MGTETEIPVTEPSVQLTQSDLLRLEGYRWDMTGFVRKQVLPGVSPSRMRSMSFSLIPHLQNRKI